MTEVLELVQFRLNAGVDELDFLTESQSIEKWAKSQAGYLRRAVFCDKDGVWTELTYWDNINSAKAAFENFMPSNGESKFLGMIDKTTLKMSHNQFKRGSI